MAPIASSRWSTDKRRGHETSARGFDGYKGHIAIDPDSEIITAAAVTAGNVAVGRVAEPILPDVLAPAEAAGTHESDVSVYGDAFYGTGELDRLEDAGIEAAQLTHPEPSLALPHEVY